MGVTHIAFVLDRSSSMESIREATIKAFNEQVATAKKASQGQETLVSLFTFSTRPDRATFLAAPVGALEELTTATYVPNGSTALYDTILEATDALKALPEADNPDTAFLVIILSDGEENSSLADGPAVSRRLEELQSTKRWTFTYLGCSEADLKRMRAIGISAGNSRLFAATNAGVDTTSALNCSATEAFFTARSVGQTAVANLYDQAEATLGVQLPQADAQAPQPIIWNGVTLQPIQSFAPVQQDYSIVVGLTESEAERVVVADGKYSQVAYRDGQAQTLPGIVDGNRVCLTVENGKVTDARVG